MAQFPEFTYTIYIKSSIEAVWNALVIPEITKQYWKHENISNWKKDSQWQHVAISTGNKRIIKIEGKIIEIIPQKLLVLTWNDIEDINDTSRVAIEIIALKNSVRLNIFHNNFKSNSNMFENIKEGWPQVLSSMKSFLETGKALISW